MAEEAYKQNPLPSHESFVPPVNPIGTGVQDWARGFRERTLHPLETMAAKAKEVSNASLEETLPTMLGVGMMAGVGAKTADLVKLKLARELRDSGAGAKEIHAATGWNFSAADGKPRFEISDHASTVDTSKLGKDSTLGDVLQHEELYAAYPHLRDLPLRPLVSRHVGEGSFNPIKRSIGVGTKGETASDGIREALTHEVQHGVQLEEGFAVGGSPSQMYGSIGESFAARQQELINQGMNPTEAAGRAIGELQFQNYERLAGETEARATAKRLKLTPEQRAAYHPVESYDVPVEKQITRFDRSSAINLADYERIGTVRPPRPLIGTGAGKTLTPTRVNPLKPEIYRDAEGKIPLKHLRTSVLQPDGSWLLDLE